MHDSYMQKNQHIELVFILDRSGSMRGMEEQAVKSFNSFMKDQKDVEGDASLSLVLFDNIIETPIKAENIKDVNEISADDFNPRATTALLDAIGSSIEDADGRVEEILGRSQEVKVIFAIFTDGYENDSTKYTWRDVSEMISKRTEMNWEFLFLAANADAIATASNLNIKSQNASQVQFTEDAMGSWGNSVSSKAKAMRLKSMDLAYDEAHYSKSLSDIVDDDLDDLNKSK